GKTTLLKILATLIRPTRGTAAVAGHDCVRDAEGARPHLGLVAHGSYVYEDLTALENLRFWTTLAGLSPAPAALAGALARVELERAADEPVRTFSAPLTRPPRRSAGRSPPSPCATSRSPASTSARRSGSRSTSDPSRRPVGRS